MGWLKSKIAPETPPADWEKFRLETWRIILLALVGAAATWLIVDPLRRRDTYAALVEGERLRIQSAVVDSFVQSGANYAAEAWDVLRKTQNADVKAWEGKLVDDYRADSDRMRLHFGPGVDADLDETKTLADTLHDAKGKEGANWGKSHEDLVILNKKIACEALAQLQLVSASRCPKHP